MTKRETFGGLEVGDKFIVFPTDGDNSGHGGYLGYHTLFKKINPCYEKTTLKIFKSKITSQPSLEMNMMSVEAGILSHSPNNMFVIKIN